MCWRTDKNGKRVRVYDCLCFDSPYKLEMRELFGNRNVQRQQPEFEAKPTSENAPKSKSEPTPDESAALLIPVFGEPILENDVFGSPMLESDFEFDSPMILTDAEAYTGV